MRTKRYIHDPRELLAQGQKLVREDSDVKFAHRVSMVNLILSGMSAKELAAYCGDGETTLMSWVTKVDQFGWDSLHDKKRPGRSSKLTEEQISEIKDAVMSDPNDHGFRVWDGPRLSQYIKDRFDVNLCVRACQNLFHKMGFSLIRPQTYPSLETPDNEAREAFKKSSAK